jgi:acetyl-CoA acetyltransferase
VRYERSYIPLGGAWSSPFTRWQGALADHSSLDVATAVTRLALDQRRVGPELLTAFVLGMTIPQKGSFYGASTVATGIGAPGLSGPIVAQACATSAVALMVAAGSVEADGGLALTVLTDRTSNGPHVVYPSGMAPGGRVDREDLPLDSFAADPLTGQSMLYTAEAVASEGGFTREQIDDVTEFRYEQYADGLAANRAFQRRYMVPAELPGRRGESVIIDEDVGVRSASRDELAALRPTVDGGVVTGASQTHPADGAAGILVAREELARELGRDGAAARLLAAGTARVKPARMPKAPVPAARQALESAGLTAAEVHVVKTHNPFAVNDLWLERELSIPQERINPYGSSLVYGHPQGPTGARAIAELIEVLAERGGGTGLFTGCAAGDTGAAILIQLDG